MNDNLAGIVELCADVDRVLPFRRKLWARPTGWPHLLGFLREIRAERFDAVLDYQGLLRSGLIAAWVHAPEKYGFADAREGAPRFYNRPVRPPPECRHAIARNAFLSNVFLGADEPVPRARFRADPAATARAEALLAEHPGPAGAPLVAIAPTSRWPSKTWPPEFFAETVSLVLEHVNGYARCWLLGTAGEANVGKALRAALPPQWPLLDLMGQSDLPTMAALLQASHVTLANDSGPMHLSVALGTPTVALFGPTDSARTGPLGPAHCTFQSQVECSPCFHRECPLSRQICRDDVAVPDRVAAEIVARLGPAVSHELGGTA